MKKRLTLIFSLILAVIMAFSVSACNLVSTDKEDDMAQVIATVAVADDVPDGNLKILKKKDLAMAYMNYGYYYVYQGYDKATTIDYLIKQLLSTRILAQQIITEFYNTEYDLNRDLDKWDIKRYLSIENTQEQEKLILSDYNEALYSTIKSINTLIDSYEEAEDTKYSDTYSATVRTVPSEAANDTTVSATEKKDYIEKGIDTGLTDAKRKKAFNKALKFLEVNKLLGDGYVNGDITTTDYYKSMLHDNEKAQLIKIYEDKKKAEYRATVTYQQLQEVYADMYNAQVSGYSTSISDFSSALSNASATSPIVYSPYSGYGYVYNLLLGVNLLQQTEISNIKATEKTERAEARKDILASTTVKDQRSSWILSGYDFDYDTLTFKGDYNLCEEAPLSFKGQVTKFVIDEENEKYAYRVDKLDEYSLDAFVLMMEEYVYGSAQQGEDNQDPSVYKKVSVTDRVDNFDGKINELLFAFSTDPGSLNTYKGYAISPIPDFAGSETYKQEFADAGRELLTMGGSSYIMVATDYGYHVMFFSQILNVDTNYATLEDYLNYLSGEQKTAEQWEAYYDDMLANWDDFEDTDFYLYLLMNAQSDSLVSTKLSELENDIYDRNESKVVKYTDRYSDFLDD